MAADKEIRVVQVVFNVADPDQDRLHRYVTAKSNRSGYLKRLIQRDLEKGIVVSTGAPAAVQPGPKKQVMALPISSPTEEDDLTGFI